MSSSVYISKQTKNKLFWCQLGLRMHSILLNNLASLFGGFNQINHLETIANIKETKTKWALISISLMAKLSWSTGLGCLFILYSHSEVITVQSWKELTIKFWVYMIFHPKQYMEKCSYILMQKHGNGL